MDMAVVAVGLYETYQSALMLACLVGFVVFSLLTVVASFLRLNIAAAIRRVRIRGGLIGLTLFALAMLFNSYPTHADKNRGSGAGELPPQSVPEVVPDGGGEGVGEAVFQVAESFDPDDATGGNFAPVALAAAGSVTIYATEIPSAAITIPSIICFA